MSIGMFTSRIMATRGEVWIPSLGILVARLDRPLLTRRPGDTATPLVGQWDLQASYSFLNPDLLQDEEFRKSWTLWVGRRPLTVMFREDTKTEVIAHASHMRIEGVDIEWQQPE